MNSNNEFCISTVEPATNQANSDDDCTVLIENYETDCLNKEVNPTCNLCREHINDVDLNLNVPRYGIPYGIPLSLTAPWILSTSIDFTFTHYNLDSMTSMRAHYARISSPGDSFTALEHFLQGHRVFFRRQEH